MHPGFWPNRRGPSVRVEMTTTQAVIFDLDDTLYAERSYAFSGFAAVALELQDRLGDPHETAADMRRLFDTEHRPKVFDAILAKHNLTDTSSLVAKMIDVYRTHQPSIALHLDADAVLTQLRPQYKLGLITDGPAISQWAKIDALKLRNRITRIIVTDDLGPNLSKPHPRAFELMAEQLSVRPQECVYVADNAAKDFIAPNTLGWTTVLVKRDDGIYREAMPPTGGAASIELESLAHLCDCLA